jgi:hypothetical protein
MRLACAKTIVVIACSRLLSSHAQTTWNPAADFTTANGNPNGVWSYGWMDTAFTTFTADTLFQASAAALGGSPIWYTSPSGDGTPAVWLNTSGSSYFGILPGQLSLHPGPGSEPSVLRWTAPVGIAPSVNVSGHFFAGDIGVMQVAVRRGASVLWTATDAGVFDFITGISPGDTLDFTVFNGYTSGNTGFSLALTAVPEPSTWSAVAGTFAFGWCAWRRRRTGAVVDPGSA